MAVPALALSPQSYLAFEPSALSSEASLWILAYFPIFLYSLRLLKLTRSLLP